MGFLGVVSSLTAEDPYGDLVKCAPFAVNVQLKVEIAPRGQTKQPSDLARLVRILKDAHYQGHVVLEYEAAEDAWQGKKTMKSNSNGRL